MREAHHRLWLICDRVLPLKYNCEVWEHKHYKRKMLHQKDRLSNKKIIVWSCWLFRGYTSVQSAHLGLTFQTQLFFHLIQESPAKEYFLPPVYVCFFCFFLPLTPSLEGGPFHTNRPKTQYTNVHFKFFFSFFHLF